MTPTEYTLLIKGISIAVKEGTNVLISIRKSILKSKELAKEDITSLVAMIDDGQQEADALKFPEEET